MGAADRLPGLFVAALASALVFGCDGCGGPTVVEDAAPEAIATLPYVEHRTAEAAESASLPMIVALHGRGSDEQRFLRFFEGYPTPARVISVQAPIDEGDGRAWWSFRGKTERMLRDETGMLAAQIVATAREACARYPTRGAPVVTGFSQGAMLVYRIALDHPDAFGGAVSVSGVLFSGWASQALATPDEAPLLVALHGGRDPIIPASSEYRSVRELGAAGFAACYREFDDVPHWIMGEMQPAFHEELSLAIARAAESPWARQPISDGCAATLTRAR